MKVCVVQLDYSADYGKSDEIFAKTLSLFDSLDESYDIIVFPESTDIPCLAGNYENHIRSVEKYTERVLQKASETAKRCQSMLFVNAAEMPENYNTTFAFNRFGEIIGKYRKEHLTPSEPIKYRRKADYTFKNTVPTVVEAEGIRFGFTTCYDNYFYEYYPVLARQKLDVIINCSHQRSDRHEALKFMTQFCAYNINTYVLRASVSMGENSETGGNSMIVAPNGEVLGEMGSEVGILTAEIDPHVKYYKPAGFGNPDAAHYEYIESGRRPYKYRSAGPAICLDDKHMPYPRTCAHRGFNSVCPENSMPAFGAAVALGADEIEFDVWYTKDGQLVSIHDSNLERVSDGFGKVYEHTLEELKAFDFGVKKSAEYEGLRIITVEEIFEKFACHTVMNIHIKFNTKFDCCGEMFDKLVALIYRYDAEKYVYFTHSDPKMHELFIKKAPEICRCMGGGGTENLRMSIVERAIEYKCQKLQFFKPFVNKEMVEKAHANGIKCNIFWSDKEEETEKYLEMGVDTILTNDFNRQNRVVKSWIEKGNRS